MYTESVSSQLFDQQIFLVQQLSNVVGWTTLIGLIVVSCLLGVTMLVSLLRTYQFSARMPQTTCGTCCLLRAGWGLMQSCSACCCC